MSRARLLPRLLDAFDPIAKLSRSVSGTRPPRPTLLFTIGTSGRRVQTQAS